MKKTLLAVAIPALLVSGAASATTIYNNNGTQVDFNGQMRLGIEYNDQRDEAGENGTKIRDTGSRFGFAVKHDLGNDLYGIGELEFGNNTQSKESEFKLKNRKAYVGLGLTDIGEFTYGRVLSPFDDVAMSDYSYVYGGILDFGHVINRNGQSGSSDNFIGRVSNTIKVMSADFNGFSAGATYTMQGEEEWNSDANTATRARDIDNAYTLSVFYDTGFGLKANAGYGHANYNGGFGAAGTADYYDDAKADIFGASVEYSIADFAIAFDIGQSQAKQDGWKGKVNLYGVGTKYNITDKSKLYALYSYADGKKDVSDESEQRVILGADYRFTPAVRTFLEYSWTKEKVADDSEKTNEVMLGMRFYF